MLLLLSAGAGGHRAGLDTRPPPRGCRRSGEASLSFPPAGQGSRDPGARWGQVRAQHPPHCARTELYSGHEVPPPPPQGKKQGSSFISELGGGALALRLGSPLILCSGSSVPLVPLMKSAFGRFQI